MIFQNIHIWNPKMKLEVELNDPPNVQPNVYDRAMHGLQPLDIGQICGRSGFWMCGPVSAAGIAEMRHFLRIPFQLKG